MEAQNASATNLTGVTLDGSWVVGERINHNPSHTGGAYSICYKVEKDGNKYFLKAYNLEAYLKGDEDPVNRFNEMTRMIKQYEYEKNLSEFCRNQGVSKVECIIDSGQISAGPDNILVPYLIFERADGDVREFMKSTINVDFAWKFHSLHDVAVGLNQLHKINVYHQDVKPSNILTFGDESKLGDLGRAVRHLSDCPFFDDRYWGDKTYMAPEVAYTSNIGKDERRMLLTDLYLLGSLIAFYFTGVPFNGLLYKNIMSERHFSNTDLTYSEVIEELKESFEIAIGSIRSIIKLNDNKAEEKLINLIYGLCNPDIERRHHPDVTSASATNIKIKYGMERVISTLDLLHRQFKFKLRS